MREALFVLANLRDFVLAPRMRTNPEWRRSKHPLFLEKRLDSTAPRCCLRFVDPRVCSSSRLRPHDQARLLWRLLLLADHREQYEEHTFLLECMISTA